MDTLKIPNKRMWSDFKEMTQTPVACVAAIPMETAFYEWHCNLRQNGRIHHLVLNFPREYPYKSPVVEFVPSILYLGNPLFRVGQRGARICLDMLDDRRRSEFRHSLKQPGWSPAYTVQTLLLSLLAFLDSNVSVGQPQPDNQTYLNIYRDFQCSCSHTQRAPYPLLGEPKPVELTPGVEKDSHQLVDYISKETLVLSSSKNTDDIWGYGLFYWGDQEACVDVPRDKRTCYLLTPFQPLTLRSFNEMKATVGYVHSVNRNELPFFLPLYINSEHGYRMKNEFERTMKQMAAVLPQCSTTSPLQDVILKSMSNLMSSIAGEFFYGAVPACENVFYGFFHLHRLLLWALESYPSLQSRADHQITAFLKNDGSRQVTSLPEWLVLLSVSSRYRWKDVAVSYMTELFRRQVLHTVKRDALLGDPDTPKEYVTENMFAMTEVSRKQLALLVSFLRLAIPLNLTTKEILRRYDQNHGFPSAQMVQALKEAYQNICNIQTYQDWFRQLNMQVIPDQDVYELILESLTFCLETKGYYLTGPDAGGWLQVLARRQMGIIPPDPDLFSLRARSQSAASGQGDTPEYRSRSNSRRRGTTDSDRGDGTDEEDDGDANKIGRRRKKGKKTKSRRQRRASSSGR